LIKAEPRPFFDIANPQRCWFSSLSSRISSSLQDVISQAPFRPTCHTSTPNYIQQRSEEIPDCLSI